MKPSLDDCLEAFLDGKNNPVLEKTLMDGIQYLALSRIKGRIPEDQHQEVIDRTMASFFQGVSSGTIPSASCKVSTIVVRIAECRILDMLRRAYTRPAWMIEHVGIPRDGDQDSASTVVAPVKPKEKTISVACHRTYSPRCRLAPVRRWMLKNCMSTDELAAVLGFNPRYVSQILSGRKRPGRSFSRLISNLISIDEKKIFGFCPKETRGRKSLH